MPYAGRGPWLLVLLEEGGCIEGAFRRISAVLVPPVIAGTIRGHPSILDVLSRSEAGPGQAGYIARLMSRAG